MKSIFQRTNYFILLAFGAMLIGFAPIFVKLSMLSSSAISFYRMFLALPFLFLLNYILNKKILFRVKNKKTIFYAAFASLAFTTDLTLWHFSMDITSVSNATIIVNSAPIFVAILSFIFFKERLTKGFLLSFLVTYIGIVGLIYFSNNYVNGKLLGDILCLIAAFFYGVYLLIIARLGKENSLNIIFYTTLFTCFFGLIFALIESRVFLPSSLTQFYNLLAMAILCQAGGQFLITFSLPKIKASFGSVGLLMQPIIATIFGALVFYEYLNFIQLSFVIIALIGIYFARLEIKTSREI